MSNSSHTTPIIVPPKRRLGLSRSFNSTPTITPKNSIVASPYETSINRSDTSQNSNASSDCDTTDAISNVSTSSTKNVPLKPKIYKTPVSTKRRSPSYKLSLCNVTTDVMTRKRMLSQKAKTLAQPKRLKLEELNSVSEQGNCDTKPTDECDTAIRDVEPTSSPDSTLRKEIEELKKKIASTEKHQQRTFELEASIIKWREAGLKTIEEIKEKTDPTQDVDAILAHFNIDPGLFELN